MTYLAMQKRRYRIVLDLELMDDGSHPDNFEWNKMFEIGDGEDVEIISVAEEEYDDGIPESYWWEAQ
tara:strand:- start:659 stop:859 length:201 start_codon:yes stop_codon:yes gene_type:complete